MVHYTTMLKRYYTALLNPAWVVFIWVGIVVGVSMIATPVRFTATTITREIALDVGRVVFAVLNKVELGMLILLLIVVRVSGRATKWWGYCGLLALIVVAQSVWLTPELAARTEIILQGGEPPASYAHAIYSSLELIKIAVLISLGFAALKPNDNV